MKPALKKILAAVAVKLAVDRIQERRQSKKRRGAALLRAVLLAGAASGVYYAYKSGRLQALIKGRTGESPSRGTSTSPHGSPGGEPARSSSAAGT